MRVERGPGATPTGSRGWAVVTGASSGIGEAIARELASRGWPLLLTARSGDRLEVLARELEGAHGVRTLVVVADLTDPEAPRTLFEASEGEGRPVELLVNNAGFGGYGEFVERDLGQELDMIRLNVSALVELTRRFSPAMLERGRGRILNVASTAAFQPGPLMAVYYATKAFVLSFSEALREELRGSGVTVTTLCPGPTASDFQRRARVEDSPLFDRFPLPSSAAVARYGVDAMLAGRGIAVHGVLNRVLAAGSRVAPRSLLPRIVRRIQEKRG